MPESEVQVFHIATADVREVAPPTLEEQQAVEDFHRQVADSAVALHVLAMEHPLNLYSGRIASALHDQVKVPDQALIDTGDPAEGPVGDHVAINTLHSIPSLSSDNPNAKIYKHAHVREIPASDGKRMGLDPRAGFYEPDAALEHREPAVPQSGDAQLRSVARVSTPAGVYHVTAEGTGESSRLTVRRENPEYVDSDGVPREVSIKNPKAAALVARLAEKGIRRAIGDASSRTSR